MTDKELDDLEARLLGKTLLGNDATWKVSPLHKDAADALSTLRKKNAGLVEALDIAMGEHLKALTCSSQQQTREHYSNAYVAMHNAAAKLKARP